MKELGVKKGTILTFGGRSLYFVFAFISGIIIARTTGPQGKGIYSLVILTASLVAILTGIGVGTANACFVGRKPDRIPSIITNSIFLMILCSILLGGLFLIFQNFQIFEPTKLMFVGIAFAIVPFILLMSLFNEILHGMNKILEFSLIRIVAPFIQVVILCILLKVLNLKLALMGWAISQIVMTVLTVLILFKNTGRINSVDLDLSLFRESLVFGLQVWIAQLVGMLNLRIDMYLVAYYLTPRDVGYYSTAVGIAEFLWYIPSSIAIVMLPVFTRMDAKNARELACKGIRLSLFSGVVLLVLLLSVGRFIVPAIYGKAFLGAVLPLSILLPGVAVYGMAHITSTYFNGHISRPIINTGLAAMSLIINVVLNIILIPKMGIAGAALSSTIAYILAIGVCIYIFTRLSGSSVKDMLFVRKDDFKSYLQIFRRES